MEWGESFEPPLVLRRLVAQGRLGKKTGQGFFPYPRPDEGQSREAVVLETRGDVGIAWLNRPPTNALSPQVVREIADLWDEVDGKLRALVIASSNIFTFSAGRRHQGVHEDGPRDGRPRARGDRPPLHARRWRARAP